jgi:O-antigen/teichoic acid export membrane protein
MTEDDAPDLGRAAIHGARTVGLARLVAESALLLSSIALARLLTPAEFGHAAVALTIVALAAVVGPAGLTAGVVQRQQLGDDHIIAASFLACVTGLVLSIATVAVAATVGEAVFGAETARLLAVASPAWLIVALGAVPQSLLLRELRFGRVALIEGVASVVGAATAVVLAVLAVGPAALVVGALATLAVVAVVSVAAAGFVAPGGRSGAVQEVGRFAAPVTFSSLVYSVFRNADYVILAGRLPAKDVGLYWRAYQLGVDYQSKVSQVMLRVSFPIYARTETLDDLRARRTRIVRMHAAVIIPLLAAFVAVAPLVIPWVFGSQWKEAVLPAQIMAIAGMAYAVATGTGPLMIAVGKPGALVRWSMLELLAYVPLIWVLAGHGLVAVSIGVAGFAVASLVAIQFLLLRPHLGIPVSQLWGDVMPGVVAGAAVLVSVWPLRVLIDGAGPTLVTVCLLSLVSLVVAAAALRLFPTTWGDIVAVVRGVRGARSAPEAAGDAPA